MINLESITEGHYRAYFSFNGVLLGDILMEVDGFFVFYPKLDGGYWSAEVLKAISDKLFELNQPWIDQLNKSL